jgi:hypothetical protein
VRDHLLGNQTKGIYPLLQDDTCWFVVDFDKKSWEGDACAFLKTCLETRVPASLERSRSGNGGHVWIFFAEPFATGRYVGEGFDDARLDTLFLAMPISWRGTLQQYVGRLHRLHKDKFVVRVYDYVDSCVPVLNRMYDRRMKGYKAVGYTVTRPSDAEDSHADLKFAAIERVAVQAATAFEEARGCRVESVESDTRGFDLISRRVASEVSPGSTETRFIEVKGRAAVGEMALTANEYKTAQRLGDDYWIYVVFNCASAPRVTTIQNPARFDWEPLQRLIVTESMRIRF